MSAFNALQSVLELRRFTSSPLGTLYRTPSARLPITIVRHFDSILSRALIPDYVDLIHIVSQWATQTPIVRDWVQVRIPLVVGDDYVTRRWDLYITSLKSYDEPDEEYPVDIPDALSVMRRFVTNTLPHPINDRQRILAAVIRRSLLAPSSKTYLAADDGPFVVVEPRMTVDEVQQWSRLRA